MRSASDLPDDIDELKRRLLAAEAGLVAKTLEAEKLKLELARLKRMRFGQSSERIEREIAQLELRLEEIEVTASDAAPGITTMQGELSSAATSDADRKPRRQIPEHLPRVTETHEPAACSCPRCGSDRMRRVGEDVTEVLEYVPGRFEVVRHVRPAYSCAKCEAMTQAPMPAMPIPRAMAGASVLAHVVMSKYADHLPLYRQAEIYARDGLDLDRGLLADWIGKAAWLLRPLADRIGAHVMAGTVIHADDTPVPVLAPGNGKTKTARLWIYLRDERPHGGPAPPAVLYRYTPDRKGERCREHLGTFRGHLHADGYSGFAKLYEGADGSPAHVCEVACWAHVRRGFFDVHKATGSVIAREALERIGALFDIERTIAGQTAEQRSDVRRAEAREKLDQLAAWLDAQLKLIPGRSELAKAIRYARSRWAALIAYVGDGRLEISNNAAENAVRPVTLGRKNWLFAGSDAGGERAAIMYTLIRTAKLNGLEPEAWLRGVLARIGDHPISRLDDLLPWARVDEGSRLKLAA
jgi:transposase